VNSLSSENGTSLTFRMPVLSGQSCTTYSENGCYISDAEKKKAFGMYQIYVVNTKGVSNILTFTVKPATTATRSNATSTPSNSNNSGGSSNIGSQTTRIKPSITNIVGPTKVGISDSITFVINTRTNAAGNLNATMVWSDQASTTAQQSFSIVDEKTVVFNHVFTKVGKMKGTFIVTDPASGTKSTKTFTVTVASTSPVVAETLTLSKVTPSKARIGVSFVITGTGFSPHSNTVNFGIGGSRNVSSYNYGTLIMYSVPNTLTQCDVLMVSCQPTLQEVKAGKYSVSVSNNLGQVTKNVSVTVLK